MANFQQIAAARDRSGLSQPPPPLQAAIASAAGRYSVPPAILTGIWRIESGSSYPNRYVNSSGYGGLFGTTDWNGTPQSQADLAASILNRLLAENGGDMGAALSRYSGGGYTAVPGGGAPAYGSRGSRPGGGGVGGFLGGLAHSVASPFESAWNDTVGAMGSVVDFLKVMAWLVNPLTWLRAAEFLAGFVLMVAGVFFLGSAAGGRSPASKSQPLAKLPGLGPVATGIVKGLQGTQKARAASGAKKAKAATSAAREQRTGELHGARVKTEQARATELRSRSRARSTAARLGKQERADLQRRSYIQGATETAAPTLTAAKRQTKRRAAAKRRRA